MRNFCFWLLIVSALSSASWGTSDSLPLVRDFLARERYFDAHVVALTERVRLQDQVESAARYSLLDAVSLWKLGDIPESLGLLKSLEINPRTPPAIKDRARFYWHWIELKAGDPAAWSQGFAASSTPELKARIQAYTQLDSGAAVAPPSPVRPEVQALITKYQTTPRRSPTLSGLMSAILPGAGHARLGLWQDAALTFALNALFIGSTVTFADRGMTIPAIASGAVASIFYVGGILSAARQTELKNESELGPQRAKIEEALFPELNIYSF